ncbi:MAG: Bax inhibitor-1 family protein [Sandaracinus sp.]
MQYDPQYSGRGMSAAQASVDDRAAFLVRTYLHLVGAIFAFVFLEAFYFVTPVAEMFFRVLWQFGNLAWLVVMGAFIGVSYLADWWARSGSSSLMQYAGLGLYVVAESVIFMPLLYFAMLIDPAAIPTAGLVTLVLFGGLTGIVFLTRKDFSWMRGMLGVLSLGALGTIVCAILFGFSLGVWFSGAMIILAGGYILYYTSNVMLHYRTDQHVAAALALFSSVALLFWYVLRIFLQSSRR